MSSPYVSFRRVKPIPHSSRLKTRLGDPDLITSLRPVEPTPVRVYVTSRFEPARERFPSVPTHLLKPIRFPARLASSPLALSVRLVSAPPLISWPTTHLVPIRVPPFRGDYSRQHTISSIRFDYSNPLNCVLPDHIRLPIAISSLVSATPTTRSVALLFIPVRLSL
jgi:hypothetical protein